MSDLLRAVAERDEVERYFPLPVEACSDEHQMVRAFLMSLEGLSEESLSILEGMDVFRSEDMYRASVSIMDNIHSHGDVSDDRLASFLREGLDRFSGHETLESIFTTTYHKILVREGSLYEVAAESALRIGHNYRDNRVHAVLNASRRERRERPDLSRAIAHMVESGELTHPTEAAMFLEHLDTFREPRYCAAGFKLLDVLHVYEKVSDNEVIEYADMSQQRFPSDGPVILAAFDTLHGCYERGGSERLGELVRRLAFRARQHGIKDPRTREVVIYG